MQAFLSFLNGFIYTATLFLLCLVFVVGVKAIIVSVRLKLNKHETPKQASKPIEKPKKQPPKPIKPIRSIEINPEEIDRIYVKKSS